MSIEESKTPAQPPLDEATYKILYEGLMRGFKNASAALENSKEYSPKDAEYNNALGRCGQALLDLTLRKSPSMK